MLPVVAAVSHGNVAAVCPDQRSAGRTKRRLDLLEIRVGFGVDYERESVSAELACRPAVDVGQCVRQAVQSFPPNGSEHHRHPRRKPVAVGRQSIISRKDPFLSQLPVAQKAKP
jgi:hypothetical protein